MNTLQELYNSTGFQMPIIYGRRRVGKTTIINQFVQNKPAIFFSARETSAQENLRALSRAIAESNNLGSPMPSDIPAPLFPTFEEAFSYIFKLAKCKRLVFVIDEYPYLAQSDRSVSSLLQHAIDHRDPDCQLFLILCGSSMSFMEHQVLGYKSPLYGRRSAQIKVESFDIVQAASLLEGVSPENVVAWYGIVGGIPLYLDQFDHDLTLKDNVARNVLRTNCFLFGEPDSFLQQELRDPANYNAIIQAIASGEGKLSEISNTSGISATSLTSYLKSLIELGILKKEQPIVDANKKKVRYILNDNLFRFWHRFIPHYLTPLQAGREDATAQIICENHLSTYLGSTFEDVCRQWLIDKMGKKNIPLILDIGRWWGTDPNRKEQAEIDIVALCDDGSMICGECKWQTKLTGIEVLHTLEYRSKLIAKDNEQRLFLFSKNGFTEECRKAAKASKCQLVSLTDMGFGA